MNENQYVIFKLGEEYYAIKIDSVETIEKIMEITRVPKTANFIKGVINLRGEIVPIIDLRLRLGLQEKAPDSETRIIVNKIKDIMIGYIVDSTYEVKYIEDSQIENTTMEDNLSESYVKGIAKDENRMIIMLDVDKILNLK